MIGLSRAPKLPFLAICRNAQQLAARPMRSAERMCCNPVTPAAVGSGRMELPFHVLSRAIEQNGRTRVCGAWPVSRGAAAFVHLLEEVISAASISAGNTKLVNRLGFMSRVAFVEDQQSVAGRRVMC